MTFTPFSGTFPPAEPTSLQETIPAYLYQQYTDDDDLQASFDSYNALAQQYVSWFVEIGLPVYTGPLITGPLLDWVGAGLYGIERPVLPSGQNLYEGPYNTYTLNSLPFGAQKIIGPADFFAVNDDVYKRVLTWSLYKGDGRVFSIRWLKRRVMRFLLGTNGTSPNIDQTYPVSVAFGVGNQVNINLLVVRLSATGGAIYGAGAFGSFAFNSATLTQVTTPISPLVPILKAAIAAGVLPLPFQYDFIVNLD